MGRKRHNKKTSLHHVIFKSRGGFGLPNNKMRLPNDVHTKVHQLDELVDKEMVKKDEYYYLIMCGAGWKCRSK